MVRIIISILLFSFLKADAQTSAMFHAHNFTQPSLLLDVYTGAFLCYSVKKERTAYTGYCLRIRRTSDNTQQDIGFTADGFLDTSAAKTFVGANDGIVTVWYDQSGNARDATLVPVGASQGGRLITSGVVERVGGNVAIKFVPANVSNYSFSSLSTTSSFSCFQVQKRRTTGVVGVGFSAANAGPLINQFSDNNFYIQTVTSGTSAVYASASDNTATLTLIEGHKSGSTVTAYKNNSAYSLAAPISFTSAQSGFTNIGIYVSTYSDGHASFFLGYDSDQTANRAGIASMINSQFSIY